VETTPKQKELNRLHEGIRRCRKCPLHRNRTHAVPGEGPIWASVLFVGEAPGKDEDKQGRPFAGRSGKFFDQLLDSVDLARNNVNITSSLKCRPPNNRIPLAKELEICKNTWLNQQISLVNPKIVVLLGKVSLYQVLGTKQNLGNLHSRTFQKDDRIYLVAYHPAAAMRFPHMRRKMMQDLRKLSELLE
jgi:uracil-DNA glycosylase family 4